jgi:hypothetical protein
MSEDISAMAKAALGLTVMAHEQGAGALIFAPYGGSPPPAEFFLVMMRDMIEATGGATGCIIVGSGDEAGMLPLLDIHPADALHAIVHLRLAREIEKVDWVALAMDTWDFITDDATLGRGSAKAAFEEGNPDASEALKVICVAPDGPGYDVTQRYRREDGVVEWEEPEHTYSSVSGGDIPALMNELVLA